MCQGKHLKVLHDANSCPKAEQPKSESCLVNTSTEVLYLDKPSDHPRVLRKVIRVLLRNKDWTLNTYVNTYAILDDSYDRTMLLPKAADKLSLHKQPEYLALWTIRQEVQALKGTAFSFNISSPTNPKRTFRIVEAFTSQCLDLADHTYPTASLKRKNSHLADLPLKPFEHVKPLVLIGADYPHLLTPIEPVRHHIQDWDGHFKDLHTLLSGPRVPSSVSSLVSHTR